MSRSTSGASFRSDQSSAKNQRGVWECHTKVWARTFMPCSWANFSTGAAWMKLSFTRVLSLDRRLADRSIVKSGFIWFSQVRELKWAAITPAAFSFRSTSGDVATPTAKIPSYF